MAYLTLLREIEFRVFYAYGPDPDDLSSELVFDKGERLAGGVRR